jgi:hypothetical protein
MPKKKKILALVKPIIFIAYGSNSKKESETITPAESPKKNPRNFFPRKILLRKIKLPKTVDKPASKVNKNGMMAE